MLRWAWEKLTIKMLRRGHAEIYMRHFLVTEFSKLHPPMILQKAVADLAERYSGWLVFEESLRCLVDRGFIKEAAELEKTYKRICEQ